MYDLQSFPKEKNVPGQKSTMDKEIFDTDGFSLNLGWNSILFPKLFDLLWEKNCSSDREKLAKNFETFRTIYSNSER